MSDMDNFQSNFQYMISVWLIGVFVMAGVSCTGIVGIIFAAIYAISVFGG